MVEELGTFRPAPGSGRVRVRVDRRAATATGALLAGLQAPGGTGETGPVCTWRIDAAGEVFTLRRSGDMLFPRGDLATIAGHLIWHLTGEAIDKLDTGVGLHAGVVSRAGAAVVLPAPSGSGKSTLTAALVVAGWDYLTEELALIDPSGKNVSPFARPLSLSRSALELFPGLAERLPAELHSDRCDKLQVPADVLRPGSLGTEAPVGAVVFPRYERGAATTCEPLTPVQTLVGLLPNTFNLARAAQPGLETLAGLCRAAPGYRLVSGDLAEAVASVERILPPR